MIWIGTWGRGLKMALMNASEQYPVRVIVLVIWKYKEKPLL